MALGLPRLFCVELEKDFWHNFETNKSGGGLALIECETGKTGADRLRWLEDNKLIEPRPNGDSSKPRIVKTYDYRDEGGDLLFQVCKALKTRKRAFIVEGERDADRLWALGVPATCNAGGAGKWRKEFSSIFGTDVAVIQDNDPHSTHPKTGGLLFHPDGRPVLPGQNHAAAVADALKSVAKVRIIDRAKAIDGSTQHNVSAREVS